MIVQDVLAWGRKQLPHLPAAALDARLLLQHVLEKEAIFIVSNPTMSLDNDQWGLYQVYITRRRAGEPVSKIIGRKEFWGRSFHVTKDVLDPRPDSETLITAVLDQIKPRSQDRLTILELGTGSGCLILTLLSELPHTVGVAVDLSQEALLVAKKNAQALQLMDRIQFLQSDLFQNVQGQYDLIISNPPYIPTAEISTLQKEVKDFDPIMALDGGESGFTFYERIAACYRSYLMPKGIMALECGQGQSQGIQSLFKEHSSTIYKDLNNIDRCLIIRTE